MLNWDGLKSVCADCTRCGLCETRHNVVFGVGKEDADIMFVGEGPGEQEDLKGQPFVGPAGKLLDDMLCIIDLSRETNCYIANIVKCRPPHNRDPLETEQDACIGYLRNQVALVKPKIIVCLGRIAAKRLIDADYRITRQHGQWDIPPVGASAGCIQAPGDIRRSARHPGKNPGNRCKYVKNPLFSETKTADFCSLTNGIITAL